MEYRKFRANNILSIVINYVKRLHSGENNKYQPEVSDLINKRNWLNPNVLLTFSKCLNFLFFSSLLDPYPTVNATENRGYAYVIEENKLSMILVTFDVLAFMFTPKDTQAIVSLHIISGNKR